MKKLNAALEGTPSSSEARASRTCCGNQSVPEEIRTAVRNNGGGHANHSLFWTVMSPAAAASPDGDLAKAIDGDFGCFDSFKDTLSAAAVDAFGSGWAWLAVDPAASWW